MSSIFRSLFLAPTPSFQRGIARIFDFGLGLDVYNTSRSRTEADLNAMDVDWYAVADDLRAAVEWERARVAEDEQKQIHAEGLEQAAQHSAI